MAIYVIPFIICLAIALLPCLIQLLVCLATEKLWIRLIPVIISALCCIAWFAPYLSTGDAIGNAFESLILKCMLAALFVAHGLPFLIFGQKK